MFGIVQPMRVARSLGRLRRRKLCALEESLLVVVVTLGGSQVQPRREKKKNLGAFHLSHVAPGAKLSGAGATLILRGEVIYIWHA